MTPIESGCYSESMDNTNITWDTVAALIVGLACTWVVAQAVRAVGKDTGLPSVVVGGVLTLAAQVLPPLEPDES